MLLLCASKLGAGSIHIFRTALSGAFVLALMCASLWHAMFHVQADDN